MHLPRRLTRRLVPLTAIGTLCAAAVVPPAAADEHVGSTVEIPILGFNDFHGRIEAGGASAGAAALAGYLDARRAENPNTLVVSGGDNIGASTFTSFVDDDTPTLDALDLMDLDASALGNHEFDQGRADVDDRVIPAVDFPYLAANLYDRATGEPAYQEYVVREVSGVAVGFIGAVTEDLPSLVSPDGIASLDVRAVVPEVNRVAAELTDGDAANGEADVLVLLVHEGATTSALADSTNPASAFGSIVTGLSDEVHAVFSGHTHQRYAHLIPVDGWASGVARPVVQAGQYGEAVAEVRLTVDAATKDVVATSARIITLTGAGAPVITPDPEVKAVVDAAVARAKELGSVRLGTITADLLKARQPDGSDNRGGESTLGNLVADVQLWATRDLGTQIAFMNPGGLRADLTYAPDGVVTYKEAADVQSFANTLVTLTLTGAQVVQVLEEQWQPAGAARPFLRLGVAGITYTYDPDAAAGDRITQVMVGDAPLDLDATYRVVANSFLAAGGDNFGTLALGTDRADSGRVDLQAFVDYMAAFSPVAPDLAQRSVGVSLRDVPEGGYQRGDTVTVDLSSLAFSAAPVAGAEVVLSIDGVEVGRAPIDQSRTAASDETGRATVSFVLPTDVGTEVVVDVDVPATGTHASFVVPVAAPVCAVEYDVTSHRSTYQATVTLTNTSDSALDAWELVWQVGAGERVIAGNKARVTQDGSTVTASGTPSTSTVGAGESLTFRVIGKHTGEVTTPSTFSLDGVVCAGSGS